MKAWAAISLSVGLILLSGAINAATQFYAPTQIDVLLLMKLTTSLWVALDASKIQLVKYQSHISYHPVILFFACYLLWIVGFPWYLIVRGRIKAGVAVLKMKPQRALTAA